MKQKTLWPISDDNWCTHEKKFVADQAGYLETMFTLANGYHGIRGTLEKAPHYGRPGIFFANLSIRLPFIGTN